MKKETAVGMSTALDSWKLCNDFLREATEQQATTLLAREKNGKRRSQYLLRIHSRLNKTRAERERAELMKVTR